MGPGPSSSHTMGPMRITYDFLQRVSKLPEDQLRRATALKVHLFGGLSAQVVCRSLCEHRAIPTRVDSPSHNGSE
jgi:Serine dehydratase beta chain